MPKVSICIAVYNVEKYIEQCVRSLFEQTLDDLEYIFVDDASPDASIDVMLRVLEDYPHRKNQIKLIRHEINQGVAATRKDAIAAAHVKGAELNAETAIDGIPAEVPLHPGAAKYYKEIGVLAE